MKNYLLSLLKHYLFWFLFFALGRLFFLLFNLSFISSLPFFEILKTFFYPLRLDYSAASYIMAIPLILLTIQFIFKNKISTFILKIYSITLIILCSIILFSDITIYSEWSVKLNYKAIAYLQHPDEVIKSASWGHTLTVFLGTLLFSAFSIFSYLKWIINPTIKPIRNSYIFGIIFLLLGLPLQFAGIRGGFSPIPISQSAAYFSKYQILNDASVNPHWNLLHSLVKFNALNKSNPFVYLSQHEVDSLMNELFTPFQDTSISVLNSGKINIICIVLESWSADLIESITGEKGITPYFHQLEKEGILFTRFYANGHRSQQGLSALLSGFPPVPIHTITDNFEKYKQLNSIVRDFNEVGYYTSFYFGGDLVYGNLKAYMIANQFDKVIDEKSLPSNMERGKLTIFDELLLKYHIEEMNGEKEPFFSMVFTGSTHSPYDEPKIVEQLTWDVPEIAYLNSAKYTDYALKQYINLAKKEPWYKNTLFILVSDHSHRTHLQRNYHSPEYQHIPMLWVGGAVKESFRGTTNDKLASQVDLPKTLLLQLQMSAIHYDWGNDMFNPYTHEFSAFETQWGLNWIRKELFLRYDAFKDYFYPTATDVNDSILLQEQQYHRAYLQKLYQQYLDF